jgi:hypothetical protein
MDEQINQTKQNQTKQNQTKQNQTKQNQTKQNQTKQNQTKQNQTKLSLEQLIYPAAAGDDDKYYSPTVLLSTSSVFQPKFCTFPMLFHSTVPTAASSH